VAVERKVKVLNPMTGQNVEAIDVPIEESNERWSEIILQDGTVFKAKITIVSIARIPDAFDQAGNPVYVVNATPTFAIAEVPEKLRRKTQ
jgi:hypothetical protein